MHAGESRNLPGPLRQAEAAFRDCAARLPPVSAETAAQRARHFAAGIRLGMAEPGAMRRLHEVTGILRGAASLSGLLPRVLDGARSLMGADSGILQLLDPVTGSLRLVSQSGVDAGLADSFAVVDDGRCACGRAAREGAQTVITDAEADPASAPHRGIAAAFGFRAIQSTPLADYAGHLLGVVSTCYRRPYRPPDLDLEIMGLYADFAGEAIAGHLGVLEAGGPADPIGRAAISALLSPPDDQETGATAGSAPRDGRGHPEARRGAPADDAMVRFANYVVTQLFSVSLRLEGARSILGTGPAHDRVAAATEEIDRVIRDIRTAMFSLADDPGTHPPDRPSPPSGGPADRTGELLDEVVTGIFQVGLLLQAAPDLPRDTAGLRIAEALGRLDKVVRDIRDHTCARPGRETRPGLNGRPLEGHERRWQTADRAARLRERVAHTARALQISAADGVTLLEQHAAITRAPGRMDYPTEVKRWRDFADQAGQLARHWEQQA